MTNEAKRLLEKAMESVGLRGSFDPADLGAKIGLSRQQAESAARDLSNAGVLVLGFDLAAHFSPDYRKAHAPPSPPKAKAKAKDAARDAKTKPDGGTKAKVKAKKKKPKV